MYPNIREEEIKNKVAKDWFTDFDCTPIIGNIDFCVIDKTIKNHERQTLLWAEAKTGNKDITQMFAQLILTIGKAKTYTKHQPPMFLGVFDSEKMAFIEYAEIFQLFSKTDFNWNVTSSNQNSKEFKEIAQLINDVLTRRSYQYFYQADAKDLKYFIKHKLAATEHKIQIDKNNFVSIYLRWLDTIKPLIKADFAKIKQKYNIADCDFYLAELFVDDNDLAQIKDQETGREQLLVTFQIYQSKDQNYGVYKISKEKMADELIDLTIDLSDTKKYENFWQIYKRPPQSEYQNYIISRRDLLVPQDVRERKGAFFTPKIWAELSKKYIADVLGVNWQDEYYIWDCAAGTGNLLTGFLYPERVFASTLDFGDVQAVHDLIEQGSTFLFKDNIFQFDFLNDAFVDEIDAKTGHITKKAKVPAKLQEIIKDDEKRKKLLIYINPPYAEAGNAKTVAGTGENKANTTTNNKTYEKYKGLIGKASNELYAQFLIRIFKELPNIKLGNFSMIKNLTGSNFAKFRQVFTPQLLSLFVMNSKSFDNVNGDFPIGFFVWDLSKQEQFTQITADVYQAADKENSAYIELPPKTIVNYDSEKYISDWLGEFSKALRNIKTQPIGHMNSDGNDFQNQQYLNINQEIQRPFRGGGRHTLIYSKNLIMVAIYYAVRKCIPVTWLNKNDQFLYPQPTWENDIEFHNDCLAFTLFNSKNRISCLEGANHWIPFTEQQVKNRQKPFASHFMTDFLAGKNPQLANVVSASKQNNERNEINENLENTNQKRQLQETQTSMFKTEIPAWQTPQIRDFSKESEFISPEAVKVFQAGLLIWQFYHQHPHNNEQTGMEFNVNASLYDIRNYFQGRNAKGKMHNKSENEEYNVLISNLREQLQILAAKITTKVYEHGFLK